MKNWIEVFFYVIKFIIQNIIHKKISFSASKRHCLFTSNNSGGLLRPSGAWCRVVCWGAGVETPACNLSPPPGAPVQPGGATDISRGVQPPERMHANGNFSAADTILMHWLRYGKKTLQP